MLPMYQKASDMFPYTWSNRTPIRSRSSSTPSAHAGGDTVGDTVGDTAGIESEEEEEKEDEDEDDREESGRFTVASSLSSLASPPCSSMDTAHLYPV